MFRTRITFEQDAIILDDEHVPLRRRTASVGPTDLMIGRTFSAG